MKFLIIILILTCINHSIESESNCSININFNPEYKIHYVLIDDNASEYNFTLNFNNTNEYEIGILLYISYSHPCFIIGDGRCAITDKVRLFRNYDHFENKILLKSSNNYQNFIINSSCYLVEKFLEKDKYICPSDRFPTNTSVIYIKMLNITNNVTLELISIKTEKFDMNQIDFSIRSPCKFYQRIPTKKEIIADIQWLLVLYLFATLLVLLCTGFTNINVWCVFIFVALSNLVCIILN
jgi:hypothetical protein